MDIFEYIYVPCSSFERLKFLIPSPFQQASQLRAARMSIYYNNLSWFICLLSLGVAFVVLVHLFRCMKHHVRTRRVFSYVENTLGVVLLYMAISGVGPMMSTVYSSVTCMDAPLPVVLASKAEAYPPMTTTLVLTPPPLCGIECFFSNVSVDDIYYILNSFFDYLEGIYGDF